MLKIFYNSIVLIINVVYYVAFGFIIKEVGLKNAHNIIYNGALALLFFNTITFLVSLYFFKKESALFKFRNRILYTMLIITSALPFFYSVVTNF